MGMRRGGGVRARRDFHALAQRRRRAAQLFTAGEIAADVARALAVSRQSVSRWYREWKAGGAAALRGAGRAGRRPGLTDADRRRVDAALRHGARAHGFGTDLWTLPRVAQVIEQVTGVHYHPGHVWKLLRALGWTRQRPARRARERNEAAIQEWIATRWPAVKKKPAASTRGSRSRTKAASPNSPRSGGPGRPGAKRPS
jgi:transposase